MNILVTGGAGYIGSHTTLELLKQGHSVTILDHLQKDKQYILDAVKKEAGEFELIKADLQDLNGLEAALDNKEFDAVIHFAASIEVGLSTKKPVEFIDNNLVGSQNLLKVLLNNGVNNIVFSSSAAVYGTPEKSPVPETAPFNSENPYGLSKALTEEIIKCYAEFKGLNAVALRYFNPAGSYNGIIGESHHPETHLIPKLLYALKNPGQEFTVMGTDYDTPDGTTIRDYIHIMDLAEAHIKSLEYLADHKGLSVFNVGSGSGSSIKEVIAAAEKVTGKKLEYKSGPRRTGDSARLVADITKIKSEMGWQPKYQLMEIMESAWAWEKIRNKEDYQF